MQTEHRSHAHSVTLRQKEQWYTWWITSRTNQNVGKMTEMVRKDHQMTIWQTVEEQIVDRETVRLTPSQCQNGTKQAKNVRTRRRYSSWSLPWEPQILHGKRNLFRCYSKTAEEPDLLGLPVATWNNNNGNFTVLEVRKCVNVKIKDESLVVLLSCYERNYPLWICFFIIIIFQHPVAVIS
jgi:hypothetical protein